MLNDNLSDDEKQSILECMALRVSIKQNDIAQEEVNRGYIDLAIQLVNNGIIKVSEVSKVAKRLKKLGNNLTYGNV